MCCSLKYTPRRSLLFQILAVILHGGFQSQGKLAPEVREHGDIMRLRAGVGELWTPSCLPCTVGTGQEGGAAASARGGNAGERKTAIVEVGGWLRTKGCSPAIAWRSFQVATVTPKSSAQVAPKPDSHWAIAGGALVRGRPGWLA